MHGIVLQVTREGVAYLRIERGDMFGHCDVDKKARFMTVLAASKSELLVLTTDDIEVMKEKFPGIYQDMVKRGCETLRKELSLLAFA